MFGMKSKEEQLIDAARNGDTKKVKSLIDKGADIEASNDENWTPLIWAANGGYTEIVKMLLDKEADIEARNSSGFTPLMEAAKRGNTEIVALLLDKGADIEAKNEETACFTSLILAAYLGKNIETVKLLLDKGADINAEAKVGQTALMYAAEYCSVEIIKLLLNKGADIEAKDNKGSTALMLAVMMDEIENVKFLIDNGADINAKDVDGKTALSLAEEEEYPEIVGVLKKAAKGNKKMKEPNKADIIHVAIDGELSERFIGIVDIKNIVGAIVSESESFDGYMNNNGISWYEFEEYHNQHDHGMHSGDILFTHEDKEILKIDIADLMGKEKRDTIEGLVKGLRYKKGYYYARIEWERSGDYSFTGEFQNVNNMDNLTLDQLMEDPFIRETGVICQLEFKDDNKTRVDFEESNQPNGGEGILFYSKGSDEWDERYCKIVTISDLRANAEKSGVDISNEKKVLSYLNKLISLTADEGHTEKVTVQKHNNDIDSKDEDGKTALMRAAEDGDTKKVKSLIDKGAAIEARDDTNWTALMRAAWYGSTETVELLIEKGADIEAKDVSGCTALILAANNGHKETVELLIHNDAYIDAKDNTGSTALMEATSNGHTEIVKFLKKYAAGPDSKDSAVNRKTAEQKVETAGDEEDASIAGNLNSGKWPPLQGELLERFINGNSTSVKKVPDLSLWSEGVFKGSGVQDCAGKILSMMFMTMKEKEAHPFFNDLMKHLDKQRGGKTKEEKTKIDLYYPITREWLELAYKTRKAFSKIVNKFYDKYSIDDVVDCASIDQEEQVNAMGFDYSQKEDETDIFIIMGDPKTDGKEMFEISLTKSNKGLKLSALCRNTIYLISSENDEIREYIPDENEQPKGHLNSSESGDVSEQQEDEAPAKGKKIKYASWPEFEEKESAREPLRKSFMPIAKKAHELIISTFKENKMPVEVRYGGGTFSFSVPQDLAKSRTRTCLRFGLLNFKMDSSYIESLYKDAADKLPDGAKQRKKDDPTEYFYNFASLDDFEKAKKDLKEGIVRSYKILAK